MTQYTKQMIRKDVPTNTKRSDNTQRTEVIYIPGKYVEKQSLKSKPKFAL